MVVLAPGGPPMSRRVYLSHLDMPKGDFRHFSDLAGGSTKVRNARTKADSADHSEFIRSRPN